MGRRSEAGMVAREPGPNRPEPPQTLAEESKLGGTTPAGSAHAEPRPLHRAMPGRRRLDREQVFAGSEAINR